MAAPAPTTFDLDASALAPDVLTVDGLARIQLSARRHGRRLRLWRASDELRELIELVGLGDALGVSVATAERVDRSVQTDARAEPGRPEAGIASDALGVEPRREPEQRKQRVGVEKEREFDDPAV
jgi:hypothetical protein